MSDESTGGSVTGPQAQYAKLPSDAGQNHTEGQIHRSEDASIFVGKNWKYYSKKWEAMRNADRKISWNWSAFFFNAYWLAYRKMYGQACLFFVVIVVLSMIPSGLAESMKFVYFINCGALANYLYQKQVTSKLKTILASSSPEQARLEIQRQGGTNPWPVVVLIIISILIALPRIFAASNEQSIGAAQRALDWHAGPRTVQISGKATLYMADSGTMYLDEANSSKFLQLTANRPAPGYNIVMPASGRWWAAFRFESCGYVKEGNTINAEDLLERVKNSNVLANEKRRREGLPEYDIQGWYVPPHYDKQTNRLEWGLKARSRGKASINYTVLLLGRTGIMGVTLVLSPEAREEDVESFRQVLQGFNFNQGERYSEFKPGDHVAEDDLTTLIAGPPAVAAKKGS